MVAPPSTTPTPTKGPITRARAKLLQDKVNSLLSMCDLNSTLDGLLLHAPTLCILRYKSRSHPQAGLDQGRDAAQDGAAAAKTRPESPPLQGPESPPPQQQHTVGHSGWGSGDSPKTLRSLLPLCVQAGVSAPLNNGVSAPSCQAAHQLSWPVPFHPQLAPNYRFGPFYPCLSGWPI